MNWCERGNLEEDTAIGVPSPPPDSEDGPINKAQGELREKVGKEELKMRQCKEKGEGEHWGKEEGEFSGG